MRKEWRPGRICSGGYTAKVQALNQTTQQNYFSGVLKEFDEIIETLRKVKITKTDIAKSGETNLHFSQIFRYFRPVRWQEIRIWATWWFIFT